MRLDSSLVGADGNNGKFSDGWDHGRNQWNNDRHDRGDHNDALWYFRNHNRLQRHDKWNTFPCGSDRAGEARALGPIRLWRSAGSRRSHFADWTASIAGSEHDFWPGASERCAGADNRGKR